MRRRERLIWVVLVVCFFAALSLLITYPALTRLDRSLLQNPHWSRDAYHHSYVLWWFKTSLFERQGSPAHLSQIYYPEGATYPLLLTYSMVYLPGLPLLFVLPPVTVYNLLLLLSFFLSGLSAYALCAYLTGNRWAGLLGGVIYAFFPAHVAHALSGHIELSSLQYFPLYLLLLIKTIRQPCTLTATLCGLALAASCLVQPLFIPFLILPLTLAVLLAEIIGGQRRLSRRLLLALIGVLALALLIVLPLFLPVLREQVGGQGDYLADIGTVRFSADLLGLLAPSPAHPLLARLGWVPAYAQRAAPADWRIAELLVYAGIIPLVLGGLGLLVRWRRTLAWGLVALTAAVLQLGPVLRIGGRVFTFTIDEVEATVALPYALLARLPLLALNRAPARLNITLMLALAVLAAFGLAWLLRSVADRGRPWVASVLMACVFVEFLVIWPVPLTDVAHSGYLVDLGDQAGRGAVLNLPLSAGHVKEMGLFYQTVHRRPVFDCWFQRPLDAAPGVAGFLDGLLYPPAERDIIPTPDAALQAQVARAEGVGHVLLFLPYVDRPQERGAMLASTFGLPVSEEGAISVYRVPTDLPSPADLVYALPNETWPAVEDWGGHPARWLEERGELMIWAPEAMEGLLRFSALPLRTPERLQVAVNDHALPPLVIGQRLTYTTPSFSLQSGVNRVDLRSLNGCTSYVGDPRCGGLSLALAAEAAGCSPYIREERCLSILLQDVRFLPQAASVSQLGGEIDVGVGDSFRLLGYDLEGESWPGDPLRVTIRWQAEQAPSLDAVLFVHLLGPDGQVAAQHDAPPLLGTYPTTRWAPGDIFVQRVSLTLPSDAESGRYRLLAGMYIYPDLVRLPVSGSRPHAQDGLVWLTDIEID